MDPNGSDRRTEVPPPLPSAPARPLPVFAILSYVLPAAVALVGIRRGLREFSVPGNDFAIMTVPAYCFFGVAGGAVPGIGLSMIALSRVETQGAKSLILLPVILGSVVVLAGGLRIMGLFY